MKSYQHRLIYVDIYDRYIRTYQNNIFCPCWFGHFFLSVTFFSKWPCPTAIPLLTGQLFSWNHGLGGLVRGNWVKIWEYGQCFFFNLMLKEYFMGPDWGALSWVPVCSMLGWSCSFGGCRQMETGTAITSEQPLTLNIHSIIPARDPKSKQCVARILREVEGT